MYNVVNGISPEIMNDVFQRRNNTHYNLRYAPTFLTEPIQCSCSESASYLGLKIWEQIFNDVKTVNSFVRFKKEIRKWKPVNFPCRIYTVFITNLGFVELNILT